MGRRLPPFAAIRAFEAAARHMSFKAAADELCVTPSAVSHQIKALETYLATPLFIREGNQIALTATGDSYLDKLSGLFDSLEQSTRSVSESAGREIRVLATPGFAARWLVPRLESLSFWRDIRLRVSDGAPNTDFSRNDADVVIHWGDEPVEGVVISPLMESGRYPVASPAFVERENIRTPEDLGRVTLFHDEVMDGWAEWFAVAGVDTPSLPRGPRFPHCELSTTAAEAGQGVVLAYDVIVRSTLERGALVRLFDAISLPVTIYSVAYPQAAANDPKILAFRDWIFAQVASEGAIARSGRIEAAE